MYCFAWGPSSKVSTDVYKQAGHFNLEDGQLVNRPVEIVDCIFVRCIFLHHVPCNGGHLLAASIHLYFLQASISVSPWASTLYFLGRSVSLLYENVSNWLESRNECCMQSEF